MPSEDTLPDDTNIDIWDVDKYGTVVAPFVAKLTTKVLSWLDYQPSDTILDLGCGEGPLTSQIAPHVHSILGIDSSPKMIDSFRKTYPSVPCRVLDGRHLLSSIPATIPAASFSKIFSNAALHWILRDVGTRKDVMRGCYEAIKPGGIMVSESGGMGNVAEVHAAIVAELMHCGVPAKRAREASPWWFPTEEDMRKLVESVGFVWVKGEVELRQTLLTEDGPNQEGGVRGWVELFGAPFKEVLPEVGMWSDVVDRVVQVLEAVGRRDDGGFEVNYVRLRFVARKPE